MNEGLWSIADEDLQSKDLNKIRDLITRCFAEAQIEAMKRAAKSIETEEDHKSVLQAIESLVRFSFARVGSDYNSPTKMDLMMITDMLNRKAQTVGIDEDILDHYLPQVEQLIAQLD